MDTSRMIMLVVTLVVSLSGFAIGDGWPERSPLQFTYFLHDRFIPPGVTAVQSIALNGNFSGMTQFGDQSVFNSVLREGVDGNSTLIGYHSGITTLTNQPNVFFITLTAELFSPYQYTGVYTLQGRFNSTKPAWDLVITGGTGSFLGARGYGTVTIAVPDYVNGIIIKYDVNMFF